MITNENNNQTDEYIFIENLLNEFGELLPLTVIYKLYVIQCTLSGMNNPAIYKSLTQFSQSNFLLDDRSTEDIKNGSKALEIYKKNKYQKINRLKGNSSIPDFLQIIGYGNFIYAVIEKYPFPCVVGYHFKNWTPKILRNYIRLYFHIPRSSKKRKKENIKIPSIGTVRNKMYYPDTEFTVYPRLYSLHTIFDYYIKQVFDADFYIFYWEKNSYRVSKKDKSHPHLTQQYNGTFFITLINLSDSSTTPITLNNIISSSYNSNEEDIDWQVCFERCYNTASKFSKSNKIIFLFNTSGISKELSSYSSHLDKVPNYSLLPYRSLKNMISSLKFLEDNYKKNDNLVELRKVQKLIRQLKKVQEKISKLSKQKLTKRRDKKTYMENMKKIINN